MILRTVQLSAMTCLWPFIIKSTYGKDSIYKEYTFIYTMDIVRKKYILKIRNQISIHQENEDKKRQWTN